MDTNNRVKIAAVFRKNIRPSSPETSDLIASLPPELRNRVFELAVSDYLNANHFKKEVGKASKLVKRYGVWREPPLLRTSKQCRGEAAPVWYKKLNFHVEDGLNDRVLGRYTNQEWCVGQNGVLLDLLEVIRATGFEPASQNYSPRFINLENRRPLNVTSDTSIFSMVSSDYATLQKVLEQAVALGRKARDQGWTQQQLAGQFAQWKKKALSTRGQEGKSKQQKKKKKSSPRLSLRL